MRAGRRLARRALVSGKGGIRWYSCGCTGDRGRVEEDTRVGLSEVVRLDGVGW